MLNARSAAADRASVPPGGDDGLVPWAPLSDAGTIPEPAIFDTAKPSEMNSFAGLKFPVLKSAGPTFA